MSASSPAMSLLSRIEPLIVRATAPLPAAVKRRVVGEPIRLDGLELDLDLQFLFKLAERNPPPPLSSGDAADARAILRQTVNTLTGAPIELASVRETAVAGADGPLRARLYVPHEASDSEPGPLVVYYHGGGWVVGDLDTHDQPCRLLARSSGARLLSVDYRLAPEHRFPAAVEDALAAYRDVSARAGELGGDPARIALAGDSAGAHLAAVTAQQALAAGGPEPAFQLLIYPVTDCANVAPSRLTFAEGFGLTKENMDWYEQQFLTDEQDRRDPRVSPLLSEDLAGVAPTLVVTAGFDPLRDEGEAYALRLRAAGVHTILRRHPGYVHGFIHALALGPGPHEAVAEMGGVVRAALSA